MSTLSVSSIQNTASPTTNIVVNADGSVTLGLYRVPGVAPTPVQIGTLWYDIGGAGLVIWNGASWAGVGGGGGGTVTGVTGTAPIVSSGGAAPAISITPATSGAAGSMSAADKAKLDGAATIVSAVTGTLPITVATGTSTPVIAINAATNAAAGSIEIATLAEAATGTDATRAATPETSVPKDAAGMAGAALLPGSAAAYGGTSATGMIRYNNSTPPAVIEYYNGSAWVALGGLAAASLAQAAAGTSNAVANTPQTSVPKDASGMTGAAILPSGNTAARPATPAAGMTRVNTQTNSPEAYINGAWSPIQSTQSGQFAGFRNLLINGNYSVNQRGYVSGTATTGANEYTLDRWKVLVSGQNLAFAASGNGNQVTAPAGGVQQVIEDINVGGGIYTLSWTGTATAQVNGSAVVNGGQVTLPANTQATVTFSGGTVSQAQLEPGSVASPFEQRLYGIELDLCQRYFQLGFTTCYAYSVSLAINVLISAPYVVTLRSVPTITITSQSSSGGGTWILDSPQFSPHAIVFSNLYNTGGSRSLISWIASSEL